MGQVCEAAALPLRSKAFAYAVLEVKLARGVAEPEWLACLTAEGGPLVRCQRFRCVRRDDIR